MKWLALCYKEIAIALIDCVQNSLVKIALTTILVPKETEFVLYNKKIIQGKNYEQISSLICMININVIQICTRASSWW